MNKYKIYIPKRLDASLLVEMALIKVMAVTTCS